MAHTRKDLERHFSPDDIAECFDIPSELRTRLWGLVPQEQPVPGEDDWPEGPRFHPYPWVKHLTDDEFKTIVQAIEKEDTRYTHLDEKMGSMMADQTHSPTRYKELCYYKDAPGLWRIYADGNVVGPQYRTKAELLADLERYALEYGCDDASPGVLLDLTERNRKLVEALQEIAAITQHTGSREVARKVLREVGEEA